MDIKKLHLIVFALSVSAICWAELDITDRSQTDPLLEIQTWKRGLLLPEGNDLFTTVDPTDAVVQKNRTPLSYKKLWGKKDVIMMHPVSQKKHAYIDFSNITTESKGKLKLYIKNDPRGDHDIRIRLGSKIVESETINKDRWETFFVKFDHSSVVLEIHATGWRCENSFVTYKIEK